MRIVVTFDTPYGGWDHPDHERQMATEVAAWTHDEPEMEYQVADALRERGHEVMLVGVQDDLQYLVRCLDEIRPGPGLQWRRGLPRQPGLEYMVPGMLEAEGYRYTGSPPLALLVSRNKAMSKKVLAYHGIRVPGFVTFRPGETRTVPPDLRFPLIVKPLQSDASAGIAQASVVQDEAALAERVAMVQERFDQPAIAEEFVEGRELYVSLIGNGDALDILPITEMVFDKRRTRPEERIATQSAKWDEDYRGAEGDPERLRPSARPRRARADRRPSAAPPSARSGSATTPASTCASPPTARSGYSRPTPIPSSATATTWPTPRRKPGWTTTSSSSGWSTKPWRAMAARSRRPRRTAHPELRCVCGHDLKKYWSYCPHCGRAQQWTRSGGCHGRRVLPVRLGGVGQVFLVPLVRRGHLRAGLLQRDTAQGAQGFPHGRPLRLGLRRRRAVPDALLPLVRAAAGLERGRPVRGRVPSLPPRGGRLDERVPLVRPGRHRAGPHPARAHPGAPPAAGLPHPRLGIPRAAAPRDLGRRPALSQGRWRSSSATCVGKRRQDEIPWTMLVGLITHELGHSFLYHHWEWTRSRALPPRVRRGGQGVPRDGQHLGLLPAPPGGDRAARLRQRLRAPSIRRRTSPRCSGST